MRLRVMFKLPLLLIVGALLALIPASAGSAASVKHCSSPKGTRAPTADLHAGFKTSCAAARKVAVAWDRHCETYTGLCHVNAAGSRWGCRSSTTFLTHSAPRRTWSNVYLKCGGKETSRGRPAVNFRQSGAVHNCPRPGGTSAQIRFLTGYYTVKCKLAAPVAKAWDDACDPANDGSSCDFSAQGRTWTCKQGGRPGVDATFRYVCSAPGITKGRTSLVFLVRVMPLPPGTQDPG